jgi:hypothetical protein
MTADECMTPSLRISFFLPRTLRRSAAWRQFGRARPGGAAAMHAGKSLPPLALSLPRRLGVVSNKVIHCATLGKRERGG